MIAIRVDFTAGRFHATPWGSHVNEGNVEWPPSLWRFMRALASVWHISCSHEISRARMESLLEKLSSPPKYYVPRATLSHARHYMPLYRSEQKKTLVFDPFVALAPGDSLYFVWQDRTLTEEERADLASLLKRLNYLGRAESWCSASLVEEHPEPNCMPLENGTSSNVRLQELLVPAMGKKLDLDLLCARTSELRRKGYTYPPGSEKVTYAFTEEVFDVRYGVERRPAYRTGQPELALYAVWGQVRPMMTDALVVAETARAALQDHYGRLRSGGRSSQFSGKDERGKPLVGHRHAYYLPLDEDRDGRIDHLLVYRAEGFGMYEAMALKRLDSLYPPGKSYPLKLGLLRLGTGEGIDISVLRRSKTWESMTPFMLVRHPHWLRKKDLPEDQLRLELERKGFPEPARIERSEGYLRHRYVSWLDFKRFRARHKPASSLPYGYTISFTIGVKGPISLGYASHFGLGLFRPVD